jgi:uncharacterized membrane protein YbhN (UPF0104 family)
MSAAGGTTGDRAPLRARPVSGPAPVTLPAEFNPHRLARRAAQIAALLTVLILIVIFAPGLGEVRARLEGAKPQWIALAVGLEALSGMSYVLMFRPIFCPRMPWRTSWEISWASLGMGSIVPASGAAGLALGGWILHEGGMDADHIARRSVAFFLLKSMVNFVAVAVVGAATALGLGPDQPLWLTAVPAAFAVIVIALVLGIPRLGPGQDPAPDAGRVRRAITTVRRTVIRGTSEAVAILRTRNWQVLLGSFGYWAFDNAVLWATFNAFGYSPPLTILLMGYLIGQLGGLLPIPGGIGGIDGGLLGTFIVYGAPAATTAAAILAYRVILFWLPLVVGAVAFFSIRRGLNDPDRPELCVVPAAT